MKMSYKNVYEKIYILKSLINTTDTYANYLFSILYL